MRAFSKTAPRGCICPLGAASECQNERCPRKPALLAGEPRIAHIQEIVATAFDIPMTMMKAQRRDRKIARPRQIAMYLAAELTKASMPMIGRMFNRDHTTVQHARQVVISMIKSDIEFASVVEALRQRASVH